MAEKMDVGCYKEDNVNFLFLLRLKLADPRKVVEWCMEMGLISKSYQCPKCHMPMKLVEIKEKDRKAFLWICRKKGGDNVHSVKRSVKRCSFFDNSRMSIINVLMVSYLWLRTVPTDFIVKELGISCTTASEWKSFCREVCVESCLNESVPIGGLNILVEIDGCECSNKNYAKLNKVNGKWVFFGVESRSKSFFYQVVENGCKEELLNMIKKFVLPGSVIASPLFKTYDCLRDRNFKSMERHHSIQYVHGTKGSQTNSINGIRSRVKKNLRGVYHGMELYDSFLAEALWKRFNKDNGNLFLSFLKAIGRAYPPATMDSAEPTKTESEESFHENVPADVSLENFTLLTANPTVTESEDSFQGNVPVEVILEEVAVLTDNSTTKIDN